MNDISTVPQTENNSGQGSAAAVPPEIRGWSWGAFFLTWIWGIFNNVWISLLVFIPVIGFIMLFVLGFKGRGWAWQAKNWDDVAHFRNTQRSWDVVGFVIFLLTFITGLFWVFFYGIN